MARWCPRSIVIAVACLLLATSAWAQQASGIAGEVRDASGGVLPGVVALTHNVQNYIG